MAGKEVLKKLEEELECVICLAVYTDPKLLICGHVFCAGCLPKLVYPRDSLACPICRKVTPVPTNGVRGIQSAFRINSLLEIQQSLKTHLLHPSASQEVEKQESTTPSTSSLPAISYYCTEHAKEELKLYCEKCEKPVCIECAVDDAEHYTHKPAMLNKICDRHKVEIRASLGTMKKQINTISNALSQMNAQHDEISQQRENIETEIHNTARQLQQALDARTTELIGQLHRCTQTKLKGLSSQRDEIENTLIKYQQCEAAIEEKLNESSDLDIVTGKESIVKKIESLTSSFQPEGLKPNTSANLEFTSGNFSASCLEYGALNEVEMLPDPSKCSFTDKDLGSLEVDQKTFVLVRTVDCNGELYEEKLGLLECEFVSELTDIKSPISLERKEKSLYKLGFTPTVKGMHQLHIKINSQHIAGSPVALPVRSSAEKIESPINTITNVVKPWGAAINQKGEIIVTEKGKHCVSVFSPRGQKLWSFGTQGSEEGQLIKPCGVAVDGSGNIVVADTKNHRIQKFTADGEFLKAVGTKGIGNLQFEKLRDLAYNTFNSKVYVIDGNRVQILDSDLSFFSNISLKSSSFNMPVSIACDSNGQVYVADCMNNRIVILSPKGEFLRSLGKFHIKHSTFNHPVGVAVGNDGLIYLSQLIHNHNRVSVVTSEGDLVKVLDGGSGIEWGTVYTQIGLAVDDSGVLYVCEFNSNRIILF